MSNLTRYANENGIVYSEDAKFVGNFVLIRRGNYKNKSTWQSRGDQRSCRTCLLASGRSPKE